ncbi:hypothetical protein [Rheinheimera sp.]|uniref:hypothetical protein n=1 Tax=Rheinheimera sp. TaxID=1869214 RepID=UPI0027B9D2EC|nr:hypothetical protein [Rheinheimera sp.]
MKKVLLVVISILVLAPFGFMYLYILLSVLTESESLNNGFEYMNSGRYDYYHIRKNEKIVVENAVVDIAKSDIYIAGIRLPGCSNTHEQEIVLSNKISYFVLNTETGFVSYYSSRNEFENNLNRLGILERTKLDYESLYRLRDSLYKRYNSYSKFKEKLEYCNNVEYQHLTSNVASVGA